MKVYIHVSDDLLEYVPCLCIHRVYASKEQAEKELPKDDDYLAWRIEEYEVIE